MDDIDFASSLTETLIEEALKAQQKKAAVKAESLTHCIHCGEKIPDKRREAAPGCDSCVDCKALIERGRL